MKQGMGMSTSLVGVHVQMVEGIVPFWPHGLFGYAGMLLQLDQQVFQVTHHGCQGKYWCGSQPMARNPHASLDTSDSTNAWLGCSLRWPSDAATLIGVTIMNRSGCWCIVFITVWFASSCGGGDHDGSGHAVCVQSADESVETLSSCHKLCCRYFGHSWWSASFILTAHSLPMYSLLALLAGMLVMAISPSGGTPIWCVVLLTDLILTFHMFCLLKQCLLCVLHLLQLHQVGGLNTWRRKTHTVWE